jgi:hypothetical protein
MTDLYTTNGPIELRSIRQPLDYSAQRSIFHAEEEYSPLPGIGMVIGISASLICIGVGIGYWIWSA